VGAEVFSGSQLFSADGATRTQTLRIYVEEAASSGAMIALQHAAESFATFDLASDRTDLVGGIDESIAQPPVDADIKPLKELI